MARPSDTFPTVWPYKGDRPDPSPASPASRIPSVERARVLIASRQRGVPEVCDTPTAGRVEPETDYRRIQGYFQIFLEPIQRCSRVVLVNERGPCWALHRQNEQWQGSDAWIPAVLCSVLGRNYSSKLLPLLFWRRRRAIVAQLGLHRSMPLDGRGGRESHGSGAIQVGLSVPKPQCHPLTVDGILGAPAWMYREATMTKPRVQRPPFCSANARESIRTRTFQRVLDLEGSC